MPRNFSTNLTTLLNSQEFDEALLLFVTVEHDLGNFRYVRGYEEIVSNSRTFSPAVFEITLPDEGDDSPPKIQVGFDIGDTDLIAALRENTGKPRVFLEFALRSNPDFIELGPLEFQLDTFTIQGQRITASLGYEPILKEPIPGNYYTPYVFPQLF